MDLQALNLRKDNISPSSYVLKNNISKILENFSKQIGNIDNHIDLENIFTMFKQNIDRITSNIPQYSINQNGDFSDKVIEAIDAWYFIKPAVKFGLWLSRGKKNRLCYPLSHSEKSLGFVKINTINHLAYVKFYKSIYNTLVKHNVLAQDINIAFENVFSISTKQIRKDFFNKKPMDLQIEVSQKKKPAPMTIDNVSSKEVLDMTSKMTVTVIPAPTMPELSPIFEEVFEQKARAAHLINDITEVKVIQESDSQQALPALLEINTAIQILARTISNDIENDATSRKEINTSLASMNTTILSITEELSKVSSNVKQILSILDKKEVVIGKEESALTGTQFSFTDVKLQNAYFTVEEFAIFCNFNDNLSLDMKIAVGKWSTGYCRKNRISIIPTYGNEKFTIVNSYPFHIVKMGYEAQGYTFVY